MRPRRAKTTGLCENCGNLVGKWRAVFCSDQCAQQFHRDRARKVYRETHALWKPENVACAACGVVFLQRSKNQKYCGGACQDRGYRQRHPALFPPSIEVSGVCPRCKTPFVGRAGKKFCSKRCKKAMGRRGPRKKPSKHALLRRSLRAKLRYASDSAYRKRCKESAKRAQQTNPVLRARRNLRNRLREFVGRKQSKSKLVGCTPGFLRDWLSAQFKEGMTWDNYGKCWVIDHIKPLAAFNLSDPGQVSIACHYSNLQPLTGVENAKKGARICG